jgi:hypothetical protein
MAFVQLLKNLWSNFFNTEECCFVNWLKDFNLVFDSNENKYNNEESNYNSDDEESDCDSEDYDKNGYNLISYDRNGFDKNGYNFSGWASVLEERFGKN